MGILVRCRGFFGEVIFDLRFELVFWVEGISSVKVLG